MFGTKAELMGWARKQIAATKQTPYGSGRTVTSLGIEALVNEVEKAEAENARLREALKSIAED